MEKLTCQKCTHLIQKFNRTLKEELMALENFYPNPEVFNLKLFCWLQEYTFQKPYEALGYKTTELYFFNLVLK